MLTKPQVSVWVWAWCNGSLGITTEFENSRIPMLHLLMTWCYFITIFFQYFKKGNILQFMFNSFWFRGLQHDRPPCPSATPRACSNSCPSSQWCHPNISSSVVPFSSTFNLSQHHGLFWRVSSSHQVAKVLELQLQHQSFQWICRTEYLKYSPLLIWRMYTSTQALPVESWHLGVYTWCLDGGLGQSCRILQLYLPCCLMQSLVAV